MICVVKKKYGLLWCKQTNKNIKNFLLLMKKKKKKLIVRFTRPYKSFFLSLVHEQTDCSCLSATFFFFYLSWQIDSLPTTTTNNYNNNNYNYNNYIYIIASLFLICLFLFFFFWLIPSYVNKYYI